MAITNAEMQVYARRAMKSKVGGNANALINEAINSGLLMIAKDLGGSYWKTIGELNLNGAYSTGTIAITNGGTTVTLTGGTWPSWAASGELHYNGQWFAVSSRTSDSAIELETSWSLDTISGETYELIQDEYTLPADMLSMGERLYFGDRWPYGAHPVGLEQVMQAKEILSYGDTRPHIWCVIKDRIKVAPWPDTSQMFNFVYTRRPAKVSFDESTNLDIDDQHEDLLECAIDYQLAKRGVAIISMQAAAEIYDDSIKSAKGNDRSPHSYGGSKWSVQAPYFRRRQPEIN